MTRAALRFRWQWLWMAILTLLVLVLAVLQYRWIGQTSEALRSTMRDGLASALANVSRDFDSKMTKAFTDLVPTSAEVRRLGREVAYQRRYLQWQHDGGQAGLFSKAAVAWTEEGETHLVMLPAIDRPAAWAENWEALHGWISSRAMPPPDDHDLSQRHFAPPWRGFNRSFGRPPDRHYGPARSFGVNIIDLPRFDNSFGHPGEQDWLLLEVEPSFAAKNALPPLLARYLGPDFASHYRFELSARERPDNILFASAPRSPRITQHAQTIPLFSSPSPGPNGRDNLDPARSVLAVEMRDGSLQSFVDKVRRRDLVIAAVLMLLLLAASAALMRFLYQAQRLADMQMEFVSNVSHELRTPITVIRTAAYNLRGPAKFDAARLARYSQLISRESERLSDMVEQILRFAGESGSVARQRVPVSISQLIDESLETTSSLVKQAQVKVETSVEPGVPAILGDPTQLRQAMTNLIGNAINYGLGEQHWIGISARRNQKTQSPVVEIHIADRGPGIPADEQEHIFDAFYRGSRAVAEQIHGTGLGLYLVKKTIEANGGSVALVSSPGAGATFILSFPISFNEPAQDGHGVGRAARRTSESLWWLAARIRALCAR